MFRNMRYQRKKQLKLLHAGSHVLTFVLTVIALVAVFDSHNLAVPPIPNLYTLHSWIGLTAVIMFCSQVYKLASYKSSSTYKKIFNYFAVCCWICYIPCSGRQAKHQGCIDASSQIFWHDGACARNCSCIDGTSGKSHLDSVSKTYQYT
jgi:Eukaryotic cytochrome b561